MTQPHDAVDRKSELYEQAPCGLITMTRTGKVLGANKTFLDWMGLDDVASAPEFLAMLRTGDRIFWSTHLGPLLDMQGEIREIAVELMTAGGPQSALLNATTNDPGDPATTIDVAVFPAEDRRSYERELLAAQRVARDSEAKARELADTLQRSLIPPSLPWVPGLDLGGAYRPAGDGTQVGGDFYDAFQLSDRDWMVVVGDVCGKGPEAAVLTALTRYSVRGAAMETAELPAVLDAVNTALLLDPSGKTCTAVLGRLARPDDGSVMLTVAAAGHPLPRLIDSSGGVKTIGRYGTILGAYEPAVQYQDSLFLEPGDAVVFFTDGVTEAKSGSEFYGEERLDQFLGSLAGRTATEIAMMVANAVVEFQDGSPRDDVALLVVRREPDGYPNSDVDR